MNQTLKETLVKLGLETGGTWVELLPFALLQAKCTQYINGFTPFEVFFGKPPPLVPRIEEEKKTELCNLVLLKSLQALQSVLKEIWSQVHAAHSALGSGLLHQFQPGDSVWIRKFTSKGLEPKWKRPFTVYLTTPTAVKVDGISSWIHHSHVKAARECTAQEESPLRLRLKHT